jgi:hypothetical protein
MSTASTTTAATPTEEHRQMTGFFDDDYIPTRDPDDSSSASSAASARAASSPRDVAQKALVTVEEDLLGATHAVGRTGTRAVEMAVEVLREHLAQPILDPGTMARPLAVLD